MVTSKGEQWTTAVLGITVIAVSVAERPKVDEAELLMIAGDNSRVFAPWNIQEFESEFLKYVGFGCEGVDLGPDASESFDGLGIKSA